MSLSCMVHFRANTGIDVLGDEKKSENLEVIYDGELWNSNIMKHLCVVIPTFPDSNMSKECNINQTVNGVNC